ncbi:MAG: hypothetical protein IPK52_21085 [Chloroflexi bacterium]|nr:hypothetical protein [Chloroflexota bacterium]
MAIQAQSEANGTDIDAAYEHQWLLIGSEDITSSTAIGWVPTYLITIENGCSLVQNIEQGNLPCAAGSASIFGCSDIAGQERVGYRLLNGFMARGGATARVGGCGRWKIAEGAQETFTGAEEQVLYGVPPGTSYLDLHCGEDMRAESNFRSVYATISGQYDSYLGEFGQHVITSGGQRFIFIHTTNPFNLQSGDQIQPGMYIGEYTEDLGYSTGPHLDITYSVPSSEYKLRYRYPLPFFNFEG